MVGLSIAVVAVITTVSLYFIKQYFGGGVFKSSRRLDGKTVLITGANTGIGKESAVDLAKRGARVIIGCRNVQKGTIALKEIQERSNSQQVYLEQLDLASFKSIRDFAERIKKNEPKLHILINNAGVCMCPYWKTDDGFEMQFGVNHLGHFLLTNLLVDLLKRSAPSRVLNLTSLAHKFTTAFRFDSINDEKTYNRVDAYSQSKLANILFTRELAKRLEGTGVTTYAVYPGSIRSQLQRHMPFLVMIVINLFAWLTWKPLSQGIQTSLYCALAEELDGVSGRYYADCAEARPAAIATDDGAAKKLWEVSAEYVGLT